MTRCQHGGNDKVFVYGQNEKVEHRCTGVVRLKASTFLGITEAEIRNFVKFVSLRKTSCPVPGKNDCCLAKTKVM